MDASKLLLREVRFWTLLFMLALVLSGATAIPLEPELAVLIPRFDPGSWIGQWLATVAGALRETDLRYPFLAYGTDWLAFGHFAIALVFVGAYRDPVRNVWLYTFGMLACVGVIPYALIFGQLRGIPLLWRLIDCCFGIFGILPLMRCRQLVARLERD